MSQTKANRREFLSRSALAAGSTALYKGKQPGNHMRNFFECIRDRSLPASDVYTHCTSVNACHMANNWECRMSKAQMTKE